jgi:hypothetical protein
MKTKIFLLASITAVLLSCSKKSIGPDLTNGDSINLLKAAAIPTISSVTGTFGYNTKYPSNSFATYLISELNGGSIITVKGLNFGSSKGSVVFEKYSAGTWVSTSSYVAVISTWAPNLITVNLSTNLSSQPISGARFRFIINGISYNSPGFSTVPCIDGAPRQYEQCTWWVSKRTREKGLPASNALYANVNSPVNANYVPTPNDILSWGTNVHQAFIESVAVIKGTSANGNVTTYTLTISEANVAWSGNNYSTVPATYTTTVKVKNTNGIKSFVTNYSLYRSRLTSGALYYKAQ